MWKGVVALSNSRHQKQEVHKILAVPLVDIYYCIMNRQEKQIAMEHC